MGFTPHPDFKKISNKIAWLSPWSQALDGIGYRSTDIEYATEDDILSGIGSMTHGGRWNVKESFPTIYLCATPEAALAENLAYGRRLKIPDHERLPCVTIGVQFSISKMLDLTSRAAVQAVTPFLSAALSWDQEQEAHESVSQAIGRAAKESCIAGLIVSSNVKPNVFNYVIFREKLSANDILKVTPAGKLPKKKKPDRSIS